MENYRATVSELSRSAPLGTGVAQGTFLAHLIHDLRILIAPVTNTLHLIRLRYSTDVRLLPAVAIAERQLGRVDRLLEKLSVADHVLRSDTLLCFAQLELNALIDAAVTEIQALIAERHHDLQVTRAPRAIYLQGDESFLVAALRSLLENAANFTDIGGHIRLDCRIANDEVQISVSDDGIGIPVERLANVFEPRSERSLPRTGASLGLGMATARKIIVLHGGRIAVTSPGPGMGSTFTVHLPVAARDDARAVGGSGSTRSVAERVPRQRLPGLPQRILVVDDSRAVQESLRNLIQEWGHEVQSALDGEEALRLARSWRPNLVLLDINLPKLNGFQVAKALRSEPSANAMMLIMMSGYNLDDACRRGAQDAGVDCCVDKMQSAELLKTLLAIADS